MVKEIRYSGLSAVPSDYDCPDGAASAMLNLVPEEGALHPIFPPGAILDCNLGGTVVAIHHVVGQDNYIISRNIAGQQRLFWLAKADEGQTEEGALTISDFGEIKDVAIVGNTLILATSAGLRYILWRDDAYIDLGTKPPFVPISFGMTKVGDVYDVKKDVPVEFKQSEHDSSTIAVFNEQTSDAVYGQLLKCVKEVITDRGFFYMPFFVRYACRLFDGSYIMHSAPILMLPSVFPPQIKFGPQQSEDDGTVYSTLDFAYFCLDYRIIAPSIAADIAVWKDVIAAVDVFVSAPIYTFDQSKKIESKGIFYQYFADTYFDWDPDATGRGRYSSSSLPTSLFAGHYSDNVNRGTGNGEGTTGAFVDHTLNQSDISDWYYVFRLPLNKEFHTQIKSCCNFYKVASIAFDDIAHMDAFKRLPLTSDDVDPGNIVTKPTLPDDYQSHCSISADMVFAYNSRINLAGVSLTPAKPHPLISSVEASCIPGATDFSVDTHSCVIANMTACAETSVDDVTIKMSDGLLTEPTYPGINRIKTYEISAAETYYASGRVGSSSYVALVHYYDNKGNYLGYEYPSTGSVQHYDKVMLTIPAGATKVRVCGTQSTYEDYVEPQLYSTDPPDGGNIEVKVYTKFSGVISCAIADAQIWSLDNFPRYVYYPDASAYKMEFTQGGKKISIDLVPHDFLNGAYYYGTFAVDPMPESAEHETHSAHSTIPLANKIYTSEVNNPFIFPATCINTVGSGSVIALSTAAKALSQGQFGQFPLYAFATDGVWALEVSATGSYSARQPISRDVCTNASAVTQLDSAVLFPTARGLMMASGANISCLTENFGTLPPFGLSALPGFASFAKKHGCESADEAQPSFPAFLSHSATCIVYDYPRQRVMVCNPECPCAYVYSLRSKEWGMMANAVSRPVPSYPDALAMGLENKLMDFSAVPADDALANGYFVSRSIKLDNADILKTIDTVIQRGHFPKGAVASALYGSRDLCSWHLVWTSKDHYLRGFRGTPYKYFRFVVFTALGRADSVSGSSVQFSPRLADQLR